MVSSHAARSPTAEPLGLPRAALRYENLRMLSMTALVAVILASVLFFVTIEWVRFTTLWFLLPLTAFSALVDIAVLNRLQYRSYGYAVDGSTVKIRHGVLLRTRTACAAVQILSVDIVQGPLLRSCGLAVIVFHTVGGAIKLGPVSPSEAERVRGHIMRIVEVEGQ